MNRKVTLVLAHLEYAVYVTAIWVAPVMVYITMHSDRSNIIKILMLIIGATVFGMSIDRLNKQEELCKHLLGCSMVFSPEEQEDIHKFVSYLNEHEGEEEIVYVGRLPYSELLRNEGEKIPVGHTLYTIASKELLENGNVRIKIVKS